MFDRRLPVRPDLEQLRHQAKDLLRAYRAKDPAARELFARHHTRSPSPEAAKLADAQLVLARSYQSPSWPRLVLACRLIDAIWRDDLETVRSLVLDHPALLHEDALIRRDSNWGPPLSYAANLGRDRIIAMLHQLGAADLEHGLARAMLQGRVDTARLLHRMLGSPRPPADVLGGPAYTLNVAGTELAFEFGHDLRDEHGVARAPVDVVLDSDSRRPEAKHRILELYVAHGLTLPDTPMMAVHRGRRDLLERHVRRDRSLLTRTFDYAEIFPPAFGCQQPDPETGYEQLPRTPLAGGTLLHVCVDFEELDLARWLLDEGMSADARAAVDAQGFGGHTALFNAVVGYPNFWMNYGGGWADSRKPAAAPLAELLLAYGADPNARASLREPVDGHGRPAVREHREITPLRWGEVFENRMIVSAPAMELIAARGGHA